MTETPSKRDAELERRLFDELNEKSAELHALTGEIAEAAGRYASLSERYALCSEELRTIIRRLNDLPAPMKQ